MKIRIDIDNTIEQPEVIIRCNEVNEDIIELESLMSKVISPKKTIVFYKDEQEFYLSPKDILFFETDTQGVSAHTEKEMFYVKFKLYELETILPNRFVRVSKSTILNSDKVYSILRSLTSASRVEFQNTHKKIYVSRNYYKDLKVKLMEKRN